MAKIVQRRRGTTAQHSSFTGDIGEITVDLTDKTLRVHDGSTVTGVPLAKADMTNVANKVGITQLALSDGTNGQVLMTNGSGTLSFTSQPVIPSLAMGGDLTGTVSNAQLAANVVTGTELANNAVATTHITDANVTVAKMATNSVGTTQLVATSVTTAKLGAAAVTEAKLATNSVATAKIVDLNVTTAKIAANAINGTKIAMGSDAQGDILYYNGTDYVRLGAGTVGQILQTGGSGGSPSWLSFVTPYDISFIAGYDSATVKDDIVVQTYGEMVLARTGSIEGEVGHIDTAGVGSAVIVDVLKNGSSIYSTKPQFASTATTMTAGTRSTTTFASGDRLTFKVIQIGSSTAGQGVRFMLKCKA